MLLESWEMSSGQSLAAASALDSVEKQGSSRHLFQHLHPWRQQYLCEEQSPHLGFVIKIIKTNQQ